MLVGSRPLPEMVWKAKDVVMSSNNSALALSEGTDESFPVVGDS